MTINQFELMSQTIELKSKRTKEEKRHKKKHVRNDENRSIHLKIMGIHTLKSTIETNCITFV